MSEILKLIKRLMKFTPVRNSGYYSIQILGGTCLFYFTSTIHYHQKKAHF